MANATTARTVGAGWVGARGFDCITVIDGPHALALKAKGMDFGVRYLGSLSSAEIDDMLFAGLAVMPVTYGGQFDGPTTVAQLARAGLPKGVTVWLDVEGQVGKAPEALIGQIRTWAAAVKAAGYDPGVYIGADALLTSEELGALPVDRYWHCLGDVVDRNGSLARPWDRRPIGWCMRQLYDTQVVGGVEVDVDFICRDYLGRVPNMCVRA